MNVYPVDAEMPILLASWNAICASSRRIPTDTWITPSAHDIQKAATPKNASKLTMEAATTDAGATDRAPETCVIGAGAGVETVTFAGACAGACTVCDGACTAACAGACAGAFLGDLAGEGTGTREGTGAWLITGLWTGVATGEYVGAVIGAYAGAFVAGA